MNTLYYKELVNLLIYFFETRSHVYLIGLELGI